VITELDTRSFDAALQATDRPVLVDFWAPWCGPCRVQLPILERLASDAADAYRVFKVNVDDNEQLAARFGITSIPTLLLFRGGELVSRFRGLTQEGVLREALRAAATGAADVIEATKVGP
jgi:thioredoxin 1